MPLPRSLRYENLSFIRLRERTDRLPKCKNVSIVEITIISTRLYISLITKLPKNRIRTTNLKHWDQYHHISSHQPIADHSWT